MTLPRRIGAESATTAIRLFLTGSDVFYLFDTGNRSLLVVGIVVLPPTHGRQAHRR
jgi:hypothetical protein